MWVLQQLDFMLGASDAQSKMGWPYHAYETGTMVQVCTRWQPILLSYHMVSPLLRITFPTLVVSDIGIVQTAQ